MKRLILCLLLLAPIVSAEPSKVSFRKDGIAIVNGKPFFPIAV